MKLITHSFILRIKERFRVAHSVRDQQETLIVELRDTDAQGNPISGLGEATANTYYQVSVENMAHELERIRERIEDFDLIPSSSARPDEGSPEVFWKKIHPLLQNNPFALCALDIAMHDLYGKKLGKPLYKLWGLSPEKAPVSNYTIGIDSIDKMVRKMKAFPWPLYKIKLGTEEDLEIVRALRQHTDATFRVDANCAWTADEAIKNAIALEKLGVEFIEQPLRADDREGMKEVFKKSVLPVIADESCIVENDVAKCHQHFHGVNIKLTKCGGITPARRMIGEARKLGMKVMIGCMTESTIGISAIAHLAPLLDYVDMDGALLLAEDIATGVKVNENGIQFSEENGTGARLNVFQKKVN